MSKKISVLLSDQQYDELLELSNNSNLTLSDYVISKLPIIKEDKVTLSEVLLRVKNKVKVGEKFTIPSLFSKNEWESFTKGSRLTVGKQFGRKISEIEDMKIAFLYKNGANLAIYKRENLNS